MCIQMTNSKGYLLDTHILIWLEHSPKRIGKTSRRILERANLYYSSISVAELALKSRLRGRPFSAGVTKTWQSLKIESAPFDDLAAISFCSMSKDWLPDTFDRQIVATASANSLNLITADEKMLELDYDWIVDATK